MKFTVKDFRYIENKIPYGSGPIKCHCSFMELVCVWWRVQMLPQDSLSHQPWSS